MASSIPLLLLLLAVLLAAPGVIAAAGGSRVDGDPRQFPPFDDEELFGDAFDRDHPKPGWRGRAGCRVSLGKGVIVGAGNRIEMNTWSPPDPRRYHYGDGRIIELDGSRLVIRHRFRHSGKMIEVCGSADATQTQMSTLLARMALVYALTGSMAASPALAERTKLDAKKAELAALSHELREMREVLDAYKRLRARAQQHRRVICRNPYEAARAAYRIVRERQSIPGYDRRRAQAAARYREQRQAMIDCVDSSVARDRTLRAEGVTDYASLQALYQRRKARAATVRPRYLAGVEKQAALRNEIETLAFDDLPELIEPKRVDCGPHGRGRWWVGDDMHCRCADGYMQVLPNMPCAKVPVFTDMPRGVIPPAHDHGRNQPGGVFGQP